jgi:DNA-directed RNA polymerase specialized sigma subunit
MGFFKKGLSELFARRFVVIKTEKEYLESKSRLEQEYKSLEEHKKKMKAANMNSEQIKIAMDPLVSFSLQLKEEVLEYEKLKRGQFDPFVNLNGLGRALIAFRIYKGMSQKDLAEKLGVSEPQVSRDERNEYHGASIEKIQKVLDTLGIKLKSKIEEDFRSLV